MKNAFSLVHTFYQAAESRPEALFLEGKRQYTYAAAAEEIDRRARHLAAAAHGRPVALGGQNTADWVLCFLAARAAGLLVVLMSEEATPDQWQQLSAALGPCYRYDSTQGMETLLDRGQRPRTLPPHAAICLPTSGSTGRPRYALRSEASLLAEGQRYVDGLGFAPDDRILAALPLCHAFALGLALGGALAAGCALYLLPRFVPRTIQRLLRSGAISILPLVPAAARILCDTFRDQGPAPQNVRQIVIGAGPVTLGLERTIIGWLGRVPARNYGCSEMGAILGTTGQPVPDGITGAPLPDVEVSIPAQEGPGSLFVRSTTPFIGYLLPDGIDTSRISPDGWYSTGDLALRDDSGWVTVAGRIGEGLRRGGRLIQPAEVQSTLLRHPNVVDAVIVGHRDEHGDDIVEAHVEVPSGARPDNETFRWHLARHLESYKIPTVWHFYDALPRTSSGKPNRAALRSGAPASPRPCDRAGLFPSLAAYRLSTAIIAAHRLGILASLAAGAGHARAIADRLNLDPAAVEVLLTILQAAELVTYRAADGTYAPTAALSGAQTDAIIGLEAYLQRSWLTVEAVEAVVRGGVAGRPFEAHHDTAFLERYTAVMGASARSQALRAWRRVSMLPGPAIDLGRPSGAWAELIRQRQPDCLTLALDLPPGYLPCDFEVPDAPLASVFLHNSVRWFSAPDRPVSLSCLFEALQPGGALIVSDIFTDTAAQTPPWLKTALMLDWLTHGNLGWCRGSELCSALAHLGFASLQRYSEDSMFELIIAYKNT